MGPDMEYDDDGGYESYEVTTTDPGPAMLVGTILLSILLYAMLPFMVACGERRDRKRRLWEYKNRAEHEAGDTSNQTRETLMKEGDQLRHRKHQGAERESVTGGIVRPKQNRSD
jgi:hypothetical protein